MIIVKNINLNSNVAMAFYFPFTLSQIKEFLPYWQDQWKAETVMLSIFEELSENWFITKKPYKPIRMQERMKNERKLPMSSLAESSTAAIYLHVLSFNILTYKVSNPSEKPHKHTLNHIQVLKWYLLHTHFSFEISTNWLNTNLTQS